MGFEDRDYAWGSPSRRAYLGGGDAVVKVLIAVNAAIFVLQILTANVETFIPRSGPLEAWFGLLPDRVIFGGEVWRLFTYAFLHDAGSFWHIFWNMYLLWIFGKFSEARLGGREFLLMYFVSALAGGVAFTALEAVFPSVAAVNGVPVVCVGASGAVMGIMAAVAVWEPQLKILLFFIIPIPLWAIVGFDALWETYFVLARIGGADVADGVAHGAHFGGLAIGLLYAKLGWSFDPALERLTGRLPRVTFSGLKRSVGAGPKVRIHRPDAAADDGDGDDLERRADAVLAKLHASGESSLSRKERATLKLYSERARAKRERG